MPIDTNAYGPSTPASSGGGGIMNSLEQAAPTIGSVLGGIAGAGLGGAADVLTGGAAIPFVNPMSGGIAGAGLGGGIGQAISNSSRHQDPFQMNDLTTAATSAGGQALGEGMGGLLGKLGGSGAVADAADNLTTKYLRQQVDAHVLPAGIDPDEVVQTMSENGVTDLSKAPEIFGKLTGNVGVDGAEDEGGLFTQIRNNHLQVMEKSGAPGRIYPNSDQINASTPEQIVSGPKAPQFGTTQSKGEAVKFMREQLNNTQLIHTTGVTGSKTSVANSDGGSPVAIDQTIKNLQKEVREAPRTGPGAAAADAYNRLATKLKVALDSHPGTQLTPEEKDAMQGEIENTLGKTAPKTAAVQKAKVGAVQTIGDLREAEGPLVRVIRAATSPMSKTEKGGVDLVKLAKLAAAPVIGGGIGGIPGAGVGLAFDAAKNNPTLMAKGAAAIPGALQSLGTTAGKTTLGAIGAGIIGTGGAALASAGGAGNGSTTNGAGGSMNNNTSGGGGAGGNPEVATTNLLQQLEAEMAANPGNSQQLAPVIAQLLQQVRQYNAASQGLTQYGQLLGQANSGGGVVGGALSQLGGALTGGAASQVGPQAATLEAQLKAAGVPGVKLPGLGQNQAGVQAGMGQAQSLLGAVGGQ